MSSAKYAGAWPDKRNMPDTTLDRKPVQLKKNWQDAVPSSSSGEKPSGSILDRLNFADEALKQAIQQ